MKESAVPEPCPVRHIVESTGVSRHTAPAMAGARWVRPGKLDPGPDCGRPPGRPGFHPWRSLPATLGDIAPAVPPIGPPPQPTSLRRPPYPRWCRDRKGTSGRCIRAGAMLVKGRTSRGRWWAVYQQAPVRPRPDAAEIYPGHPAPSTLYPEGKIDNIQNRTAGFVATG